MDRQQAAAKLAELRKHADKKNSGAKKSNGDAKVDAEIARLAALSPVEYEQQRKDAAEQLGMRASILDKLVRAERPDDDNKQGGAIEFPEPELWPEPLNGALLLDDIAATIRDHVVMSDVARDTAALWVLHTYLPDRSLVSPRLTIASPEKRCGKTTLLDVLGRLVLKALPTAHVTAAAIFRVVEAYRPTLLIDEADTFLRDNDELRGVVNSGHRKGGSVLRTVGDDYEPRSFSTYAACAIALIGRLPETLQDRSVIVSLKRRLPSESIASFRPDRAGHLDDLARKAARGRPWAEYRHGKAMTQNQLARALKPLGIIPENMRVGDKVPKGYILAHFEDAFARYLPQEGGFNPLHRYNADGTSTFDGFQPATPETDVADRKCEKANNDGHCSGVAVQKGDSGENRAIRRSDQAENGNSELTDDTFGTVPKAQHHATSLGSDDAEADQAEFGSIPKRARAQVEPPAADVSRNGAGDLEIPPCLDRRPRCKQCNGRPDGSEQQVAVDGREVWLHPECRRFYRPQSRQDGKWVGTYVSDDDDAFIESGKFK